ncbi:putative hexosyltransferase [Medicago truncatula]|uniref:Putative hexosyltransferase n=1 Tax=Medicago truncatula TaxID=3880 RepID=A0A396J4R4_MEDTR|nr:putative hexosyltransferase [Medicago truncatula]
MRSMLQSVLYVGFLTLSIPLPPLPPSDRDETGCLSWLDKQKSKSVIYVSFGTVATPPPNELVALTEALEESGFPFLWSLKDKLKGILPDGFLERTSYCGKIVHWGKKMREKAQKVKRTMLDAAGPHGKAAHDFKTLVEIVSSS